MIRQIAAAMVSVALPAAADTLTVCKSGCDFVDIQTAIEVADSGDTILLADESYSLASRVDIEGKSITILGPSNGLATLDGSALPTGAGSSMMYLESTGSSMRIENLRFQGLEGTGVRCTGASSPLFVNCEFTGLARGVDAANFSGPDFFGCRFYENSSASIEGIRGAAMELNGSETIIEDCVFSQNDTPPFNGELFAAVKATTATTLIVRNSTFCENTPSDIAGRWQDSGGNSFSLLCEQICTGDLTQDRIVNAADLGLLIGAWNTDGSIVEGSDINDDDIVNAADLGLLIGAWGACP